LAAVAARGVQVVEAQLRWLVHVEQSRQLLAVALYLRLQCDRLEAALGEVSALFVEALKTLYALAKAVLARTGSEEATERVRKELQRHVSAARNALLIDSGAAVAHVHTAKRAALSVAKLLHFVAFQHREQQLRLQQQQQQQQEPQSQPQTSQTATAQGSMDGAQ